MLNNDIKIKKAAQPIKSFCGGSRGAVFSKSAPLAAGGTSRLLAPIIERWILFLLLFSVVIPGFIKASGQYRVLSWKGDVKIRKDGTFISLAGQSQISLKKSDAIWIANGAKIEFGCPDGLKREFKGPRFSRVETLEKVKIKSQPSFYVIFFKNLNLGEYIARDKVKSVGGTRARGFESSEDFYEKLKQAIPGMEDRTPAGEKNKEVEEALAIVDHDFDAAPPEVKIILRAKVYKHFNRDKQALKTAFNYYETILKVKEKQKERALLEEFVIDEVLPVVVTYEVEEPSLLYGWELDTGPGISVRFDSNFKVWWAAFSFDGKEIKEIEKTIDRKRNPQESFTIRNHPTGNEKNKPYYLFIIANPVWSQLEKYDDIEIARKELLEGGIPETSSNTAKGFRKVTVKINLSKLRRLMEEKMKRAARLSFLFVCLFFGICF
jgi:hypothetical protein